MMTKRYDIAKLNSITKFFTELVFFLIKSVTIMFEYMKEEKTIFSIELTFQSKVFID